MCDPTKQILTKILPFTQLQDKLIRRGGATGVLKNICFDSARHDWLLGEDVNVLPFILLPLAGPEEFSEEDNDKFPIELQVSDPIYSISAVLCNSNRIGFPSVPGRGQTTRIGCGLTEHVSGLSVPIVCHEEVQGVPAIKRGL